jgi:hypothetical protein
MDIQENLDSFADLVHAFEKGLYAVKVLHLLDLLLLLLQYFQLIQELLIRSAFELAQFVC